jgi:hypothetical protein
MNHVMAGKKPPKPLTKEQRKKIDPNDPLYKMQMDKERRSLQLGLDKDEDSRKGGMSIRDEFDSDGTSMISRGPDSVMGGVREPR